MQFPFPLLVDMQWNSKLPCRSFNVLLVEAGILAFAFADDGGDLVEGEGVVFDEKLNLCLVAGGESSRGAVTTVLTALIHPPDELLIVGAFLLGNAEISLRQPGWVVRILPGAEHGSCGVDEIARDFVDASGLGMGENLDHPRAGVLDAGLEIGLKAQCGEGP